MKFENIRAAVNAHYDAEIARRFEALETVTCSEALGFWWYLQMLTTAALKIVKDCDPDDLLPEEAKKKMRARILRNYTRYRTSQLQKIEAAENAPDLEDLSVVVEWTKNRTWGMNPTATATVNHNRGEDTTGRASGCGYDKRSAAIASALNDQPSVMRILYAHAEQGKAFPNSVHVFAGVPYFEGGYGASCFRNVFEACGYEWKELFNHDNVELYCMEKA